MPDVSVPVAGMIAALSVSELLMVPSPEERGGSGSGRERGAASVADLQDHRHPPLM